MTWPRNKANAEIKWKIWYHDPNSPTYYTTYSNLDGPPRDAPVQGVICIVQTSDGGRSKDMVHNADFYIIDEEGKWTGCDQSGLDDRQANSIPYHALKHGRWVNTDRHQAIRSAAHNDLDFGGLDRAILLEELDMLVDRSPMLRVTRESRE